MNTIKKLFKKDTREYTGKRDLLGKKLYVGDEVTNFDRDWETS